MALIACPECAKQVSDKAPACPHCGAPIATPATQSAPAESAKTVVKKAANTNIGCGGAVAILLVLGLALSMCNSNNKGAGSSSDTSTVELHASVSMSLTTLSVTNRDTFDWRDCKIELNPEGFSSGYELANVSIAAGQTIDVGAMQFAKDNGERFNPFTHKAMKIAISCSTQRGDGFYFGGWK